MDKHIYTIEDSEDMLTPCLVYYKDIIRENTTKAIALAGGSRRLWPHVKSHKSPDMVKLQMEYGIEQFKAATIAEAEMAAEAGARRVILAFPLIGPNIGRYLAMAAHDTRTEFFAVGDDYEQLSLLSRSAEEADMTVQVLLDVNMGMNRTGIVIGRAEELYRRAATLSGLRLRGLHCYDGNHNNPDITLRDAQVIECDNEVAAICARLAEDGLYCDIVVAGGTPAFPCHAKDTDWYLSPGTAFLTDAGYYQNLPDLEFIPGAALLTRVISHPDKGLFTLDLGYKGIAADPTAQRGYIVGMEKAKPVLHSEEHWVFEVEADQELPAIGTLLYVIPTHICPTSALYPSATVVEQGVVTGEWEIAARNRKIRF